MVVAAMVGCLGVARAAPDPWAQGPRKPSPVSSELRPPDPEVRRDLGNALPAVPAFELPVPAAGTHGVRELAVLGKPLLGTEIQVSGYVLWIYDCASAERRPKESAASVKRRIDADPTICERKKLYLGDTKDTPLERALWVVDVPRPPTKLEKQRLPKDELAAWPKVPAIAVGDHVTITGSFALASPHSERNSDGLLVWKDFTPSAPGPMKMAAVQSAASTVQPLVAKAVPHPPKDQAARDASVKASNEGTRAYGQKQYETAIERYGAAVKAWDGNHVAWYGMAGALIGKGDWHGAEDAMTHAFEIAPDQPMYAMVYGYAAYNRIIGDARTAQATREGRDPASVTIDLASLDFSPAEARLRRAVQLEDRLWRAHYYLGRIERDLGRPRSAAEELTKALSHGANDIAPWIALCELYRQWQHPELAAQVAALGTLNVSGDIADLWYELGMSHDDRRDDVKAIEAFGKALEAQPGHRKALFQRGQAYFRSGDFTRAKADLDVFVGSQAPGLGFAQQQATKMLMDIAARKRR